MNRRLSLALFSLTALLTLSGTALAQDQHASAGPGTIPEVAAQAGQFGTLLTAVNAAGLAEALSAPGPLTVFAPTDAAFAALPEGALDALLADPAALRNVLLFHVVAGAQPAAQVVSQSELTTLLGPNVRIAAADGTVTVNGATITVTDIQASNGIIHVIDAVMLPPTE